VVVVGSGAAGTSAAWTVKQAGLSTVVLEREAVGGGASVYAGRYYGVATPYQEERGIVDSVDAATADWPRWSYGGEANDPRVQLLIQRSAEAIVWIVEDLGVPVDSVSIEHGFDDMPARMHSIVGGDAGPVTVLLDRLAAEMRFEREATSVVFDDGGRVIGVKWRDPSTGDEGWIRADATVVATGGFARDLDRVLADRPEIAGTNWVVEIHHTSDGGGIALLEGAGAQWHNQGRMGFYNHSIADPRPGMEGEAMWVAGLHTSVMLDSSGNRLVDELQYAGFTLVEDLLATPDRRIIAVLPGKYFDPVGVWVPGYNWADESRPEVFPAGDAENLGFVRRYATVEELAAGEGMDEATVVATFARYEDLVASGVDEDFGKVFGLDTFLDTDYVAMDLVPGAAKSFVGFALDADGRIVDAAGLPIPGLYGAGEVTGFLGTPAVGKGISGGIAACFVTGIAAGETVAADLAAADG
jgi:fumarate reductase flavoprotein subunit